VAANQVKFTLKFSDDGGIELVGKKADKAAKSMDKMSDATDGANKRKKRYNKVEKGVAGATSNSTKAFTKQAGAIQGGLVPAYAILAANVFAVSAAFGVLQRSAALEQLEAGLIAVGNAGGRNLPFIANELVKITDSAISAEAAMRATAVAASSGFSSAQLMDLTRVAKGASLALGRNLPDAIDRLVRGTAKLEPEILDELGILVRLDDATRKYATQIGKTAGQLTNFERQQAFLNATIEQGKKKFSLITETIPVNEFDRLAATFSNATQSILEFINDGLEPLIKLLADSPATLMTLTGTIGAMGLSTMVAPLTEMASSSADAAQAALDKMNKTSEKTTKTFARMGKGMQQFNFMPPSAKALEESFKNGSINAKDLRKTTIATQASVTRMGNTNLNKQKELEALRRVGRVNRTKAQNAEVKGILKALANRKAMLKINKQNLVVMKSMLATEAAGGVVSAASIAAGTGVNASLLIRKEMMETIGTSGFFGAFSTVFSGFGKSFIEAFKPGLGMLARIGLLLGSLKTLALGFLGTIGKFAGPIGLTLTALTAVYFYFKDFIDPILAKVGKAFGFVGEEAKTAVEKASSTFNSFTGITVQLNTALANSTSEGEKFTAILKVQVGLMDQLGLAIKKANDARFDETQARISAIFKEVDQAENEKTRIENEIKQKKSALRALRETPAKPTNSFAPGMDRLEDVKRRKAAIQELAAEIKTLQSVLESSSKKVTTLLDQSGKIDSKDSATAIEIINSAARKATAAGTLAESMDAKEMLTDYASDLSNVSKQLNDQMGETSKKITYYVYDKATGEKQKREFIITHREQLEELVRLMNQQSASKLASIESSGDLFSNLDKSLITFSEKAKGPFSDLQRELDALKNNMSNLADDNEASAFLRQFFKEAQDGPGTVTGKLAILRKEAGKSLDGPITTDDLKLFTTFEDNLNGLIKGFQETKKNIIDLTAKQKLLSDLQKQAPQLTKAALDAEQNVIREKIKLIDDELMAREMILRLSGLEGDKLEEVKASNEQILQLQRDRLTLSNQEVGEKEIGLKHDLAMLPVLKTQNTIAKEAASLELQRSKTTAVLLSTTGKLTTLQKNEFQLQAIENTVAAITKENELVTKRLDLEIKLRGIQLKEGVTDQAKLDQIDKYLQELRENIGLEQQLLDIKLDQAKAAKDAAIVGQITSANQSISSRRAELSGVDTARAQDTYGSNIAAIGTSTAMANTKAAQGVVAAEVGLAESQMNGTPEEVTEAKGSLAAAEAAQKDTESQGNRLVAMTQLNEAMRLQNTLTEGIVSGYGAAGAAMNQMTQGAEMLTSSLQNMAATGPTLENVGHAIAAIGQMAAGSAKAEVAAIDQQIKAEQKRDGKSKESLAKIRSLEKKKEAAERKAFERKKKADMAGIVIATASSVMQSFKNAGGFPLGMPMALAMGAIGAMQLSMVASQQYQGGGASTADVSGPTGISVGSRNNSVDLAKGNNAAGELAYARGESGIGTGMSNFQARPAYMGKRHRAVGGYTTGFMVGEQGPELFMPDTPGEIVSADESQNMMSGGVPNVNFTISAIDAQGVEQVLLGQRENIIGMIREAAHGNGEFFLEGVN
jgi:hypothetical protein